MDKDNGYFRSGKGPIIIAILLSVPILLLATFIFSTPPRGVTEETLELSTEASTTNTARLGNRILSSPDADYSEPIITASDGKAYFVWKVKNVTDGKSDVSFTANTINRTRNLSNNTGNVEFPQIAAADDNVHVVWQDKSNGNNDVLFKRSANNGSGFSGTRNLSNNTGNSELPQIAAAGGNVYVVWQDNSNGNNDILFKRSRNNGSGFSGTRNLSENTGNSELPQIVAAGGNVYVVWQDNTTGDSAIYFIEIK